MQDLVDHVLESCRGSWKSGRVATYIPELSKARGDAVGLSLFSPQTGLVSAGDHQYRFTMQSVSKIVSLAVALSILGPDEVFSYVGMAPIADPFNSIIRLEMDSPHRPHNPLINSGTIAVLGLLPFEGREERFSAVRQMAAKMMEKSDVEVDMAVYLSERESGHRNRALAWFLKSVGNLSGNVDDILDSYFLQCSLLVTSDDLALLGATLASGGVTPLTGKPVVSPEVARIVRTIMATCGMYDGSGEFAVRAGIPAKSGVGGGICAAVHKRFGIGACGPSLDEKGNSVAGVAMLSALSHHLDIEIY